MDRRRAPRPFGHSAAWRARRTRLLLAVALAALVAAAFVAAAARFGVESETPLEGSGARAEVAAATGPLCVDVELEVLHALGVAARIGCVDPDAAAEGRGERDGAATPPTSPPAGGGTPRDEASPPPGSATPIPAGDAEGDANDPPEANARGWGDWRERAEDLEEAIRRGFEGMLGESDGTPDDAGGTDGAPASGGASAGRPPAPGGAAPPDAHNAHLPPAGALPPEGAPPAVDLDGVDVHDAARADGLLPRLIDTLRAYLRLG